MSNFITWSTFSNKHRQVATHSLAQHIFIEHLLCTNPGANTQISQVISWSSKTSLRGVNHEAGIWCEIWRQITFRDDKVPAQSWAWKDVLSLVCSSCLCLVLPSSAPTTARFLCLTPHFRLVNPQLLEAFPDPTGAASPLADLWQLCLPLSRWIALHDSYLLSCLLHKNMKSSKREVPPDSSS